MKPGFIFYVEYEKTLSMLSDEEMGRLVRSIFVYERTQELPEFKGLLKMAFSFIKEDLDRQTENYNKRSAKNRENGKLGGRPKNPVGFKTRTPDLRKKANGYFKNPKNPVGSTKQNKTKQKLIKTKEGEHYLETWNKTFSTNYTSTRQIEKPLWEWLDQYSIEQVCEAVKNITLDDYWKDKDLSPEWLLRMSDSSGPVDRIGKFLNIKKPLTEEQELELIAKSLKLPIRKENA